MSDSELTLVCSPCARRITLSVRGPGEVRLTYPRFVSRERALAFYEEKRAWVERALERVRQRQQALPQRSDEEQRAEVERLR
ncbi:MAG: M48 family metallopeptidase, partial [Alistipes sp.]|nr:M48 family metallopeptidase [Alistipes sp.]